MGGNIGQGCGFTNRDKRDTEKLRELWRQISSPGYSEVALGEKSITSFLTSVSVDMAWNKPEPLPY
jgi:hypothetical protein